MKISLREDSVAAQLLFYIGAAESLLTVAFLPPSKWQMLSWCPHYTTYRSTVYRLIKNGSIELVKEKDQRFLKLTREGRLQVLFAKACQPQEGPWDGKWRMVIFDIPEQASLQRAQLRMILRKNKFTLLQQSVYVSPYPLRREGLEYLKEEGLDKYIRIARIDEMDDDKDLKKQFGLK